MNNIITKSAQAGGMPALRTIPEIEADILAQKRTIGASIVFIGRALIEAKEQLSHGEWGRWLEEKVNFSQSSAENYMRIAQQVSAESSLLNLPYSKILALLSLPEGERESFADANNAKDKSVSQIKQLIRERDEARAQAEKAGREVVSYQVSMRSESTALKNAKYKIEQLEEQLKNAAPREVRVEVVPEDYQAIKTRLDEAEREIVRAEEERDNAIEELEAMEAEKMAGTAGADPLDVTPFCDACSALLNKLYSAPYAKAFFATKNEVELKRYETNVRLIMEWAVKVQDVIDAVQCDQFGDECVFQIL